MTSTPVATTGYTDSTVVAGSTYWYRVSAVNAGGEGPQSGSAGVTVPSAASSYTLTVVKAGTGSGTVTSGPAGIACGADCTETYTGGTTVTLTAVPAAGSTFTGWAGGGCSGTGTCTLTLAASASVTATFMLSGTDNPIVVENGRPGSAGWQLRGRVADDRANQIKGYASATSVAQNASITLYVTVSPAQTFTIDFYRVGWYGGLGGRLLLQSGPLSGVQQPSCPRDGTVGLIACDWSASYTLTVPASWTSGVYLAVLTNAAGYQNYVVFVVRDDRPAAILYQQSVTTYQAYKNFPDNGSAGKSLYDFNSYGPNTVAGSARAVKVSFDRPYTGNGAGQLFNWEIYFVRWLERSGYDVTYSTDLDTHANGGRRRNHRAFLSVGHDEYWSKPMFDAVESARDAGVNLGFFGADTSDWQVRFEPSASGVPDRVMVCYKDAAIDPVQGPTTTVNFRDPPVSRPEQTLVGVMWTAYVAWDHLAPYSVLNSGHPVYAGTGFRDGDTVAGIVGYEMDRYIPEYAQPPHTSYVLLSESHFTDIDGRPAYSNSSIYQAPSGSWVFAAGTISWAWGLDDFERSRADSRIQETTATILKAFFGAGP